MSANGAVERLEVRVGLCTDQGRRPNNEDYVGVYLGTAEQQARLGIIAAIADGVGGAKGGRVAAEVAVRMFIDAYLSQSETRGVRQTSARGLEAVNRWIYGVGRCDPALQNMACTFTALVLRGRLAHIIHVGDTRLYRLRGDRLSLLTEDHTLRGPERSHVLTRAVGSAPAVQIDYSVEDMRVHDRFLLCSDGVHGVLSHRRLQEELSGRTGCNDAARQVVSAAIDARTSDNVTAVVIDVLSLPPLNLGDLQLAAAALPIIPAPRSGAAIDGYCLGTILTDGRYSRVFRAFDEIGQQSVIVKFPKGPIAEDEMLRQAFLRESWLTARVRSPWVGECLEIPNERRTCLYSVAPWYEGETLERRLARPPSIGIAAGLGIALRLAKAVGALHRAGIVHRDIKPDNVILQPDGGLKLIDLGVARLPHLEDLPVAHAAGTPSYMAPELLAGEEADERSDLFALGVTIYRMFARAYPYGEVEPFSHPRFNRPVPLTGPRPDLPDWLDRVLARAFAVRREERFEDVLELIFELEHGADRTLPKGGRRLPLYHRHPVRFLQIVCIGLALLLFAAIARLARP
jgi:serine/threonine protein phosphatase PrpC